MSKRWIGAAGMAALLAAAPALAGRPEVRGGVLHVLNGSDPAGGRREVALQEVWRAGGEDGEDFFGLISQARIDDDGTVYLLDTRLSEVPVYSAAGERLATLSREGEGPGETRMPSNLLFFEDGTLGLVQIFPGRITKIGRNGDPVGVVEIGGGAELGGFLQVYDGIADGEELVVSGEVIAQTPTGRRRTNFVSRCDARGVELRRYYENVRDMDFSRREFDEAAQHAVDFRKFALGRDGRLYVADRREAYALTVYRPDGTVDRIIEREFTPRERSEEEFQRVKQGLETRFGRVPGIQLTVARRHPTIAGVELGPDGNLWITHSRSGIDQPAGVLATWDVFDPDGDFISQVAAVCPGDGENDLLIWGPHGTAVLVTGYQEALKSLMGGGGASGQPDEADARPMEVIFLKAADS